VTFLGISDAFAEMGLRRQVCRIDVPPEASSRSITAIISAVMWWEEESSPSTMQHRWRVQRPTTTLQYDVRWENCPARPQVKREGEAPRASPRDPLHQSAFADTRRRKELIPERIYDVLQGEVSP